MKTIIGSIGRYDMADALDKLIVDEKESLDVELLAELVRGYLRFTKEGEIIFEKEFSKLKDYQKVMVYLLGRKVVFVKKLNQNFKEEVSYKDISKLFGIKESSIRKYASLELKGIIRAKKGNYKIPTFNLLKCEEIFKKQNASSSK